MYSCTVNICVVIANIRFVYSLVSFKVYFNCKRAGKDNFLILIIALKELIFNLFKIWVLYMN